MRRVLVFVLAVSVAGPCLSQGGEPGAAPSFPFNGGFELVANGRPVGWEGCDSWLVRTEAAAKGRYGLRILPGAGRRGDQIVTNGYLRVSAQPLRLSFVYRSETGGVAWRLLFCDAFGHILAEGPSETLPSTESWTRYEREIQLPAAIVPTEAETKTDDRAAGREPAATAEEPQSPATRAEEAGQEEGQAPTPLAYGSVRLAFRVETDNAEIRLDDVVLDAGWPLGKAVAPPKIKAEQKPNLLPAASFAAAGAAWPKGWTPADEERYALALATTEPETNSLLLQGDGKRGAAWLSTLILLEGALPYSLQANVSTEGLEAGAMQLLLLVMDPREERAVWLQEEAEIGAGQSDVFSVRLPRIWSNSTAIAVRVGFLLRPGSRGVAQLRSAALRPEPLSLSVRPAARAGGFKRPSDVLLFIAAVNNTYVVLKPKAILQVRNAADKIVAQESRPIVIGARSAAYFPYRPKLKEHGAYRLLIRLVLPATGKELACGEYSFSLGEESMRDVNVNGSF